MRYVAPACSVSEEVTLNCKLIDKQLSLITSMKQITCVVISPTYRAVVGLEHADKQTDGLDFLSCFHFIHRIQLYKSVTSVFTYYMRFSQHEDSTENIYTKITSDMQLTRGPLWAKKIRVSEVFFFHLHLRIFPIGSLMMVIEKVFESSVFWLQLIAGWSLEEFSVRYGKCFWCPGNTAPN